MTLKELHEKRRNSFTDEASALKMDVSNYRKLVMGARMSPETARKLAVHFGYAITEHQLLFPEDYQLTEPAKAS